VKERIGRAGTRQVLVPLQPGRGGFGPTPRIEKRNGLTCIEVDVAMAFGPLGLFLWGGVDGETYVHDLRSTNWIEGLVSSGRIPGRFFSAGKSFEELQELARRHELGQAVRPEQLLEMHEVPPNGRVGVAIEGPFVDACFWGLTYQAGASGGPQLKATLRRSFPDGERGGPTQPPRCVWKGQVLQQRLLTEDLIADVEAESEASAVALMELCARPWRRN
jgi:hypothetical protein